MFKSGRTMAFVAVLIITAMITTPVVAQKPKVKFCYIGQVNVLIAAAMYAVREDYPTSFSAIDWSIKVVGRSGNLLLRDAVQAALSDTGDCDIILGPGSSLYSTTISGVMSLPWMDFASTSNSLSDKWSYPWFSRIIPTDDIGAKGIRSLLKHYGWTRAMIVCTDEAYGQSLSKAMSELMGPGNHETQCVKSNAKTTELQELALSIKQSDYRVIIVVMAGWTDAFVNFETVIAQHGLNGTRTFVFSESICSGTESLAAIDKTFHGGFCVSPGYNLTQYLAFHERWLQSAKTPDYVPEIEAVGIDFNWTARKTATKDVTYSGFVYDAYNIDAVKHCMQVLDEATRSGLFNSTSSKVELRTLLRTKTALGFTGHTILDSNGDRVSTTFDLASIHPTEGVKVFGVWDGVSSDAVTVVPGSTAYFNTADGAAPSDTTKASSDDSTDVAAIVVPVVVIVLLFVLVMAILIYTRSPTRYAPTDMSKPFAMVITDIERSTPLWNQHPDTMSAIIRKHNAIIRRAVVRNKGYEVATAGDSFTIAAQDVRDAVNLAEDIQMSLFEHRWHAPEIDNFYKDLDSKRSVDKYVRSYEQAWNGPRIRIGIHFGFGSQLKVATGYEYGGAVAEGCRTLSNYPHGGQIVASASAYAQMHDARKDRCKVVKADGKPLMVTLPSEEESQIFEVQIPQLSDRRFPPVMHPQSTSALSVGGASSATPLLPTQSSRRGEGEDDEGNADDAAAMAEHPLEKKTSDEQNRKGQIESSSPTAKASGGDSQPVNSGDELTSVNSGDEYRTP